uniref:S(Hydroxymethyl)glutathione dehydrogenase putative n=1 Tax=Albugo laibachii Nc14 TaxID=890382 RepID=F0WR37_9STRA|nr:S(hydroxymethyl)glutathione dehydrogenase putative [Albugo laibachii Nc14]|eukprot:CCA23797.1 S(hydroxymethyl)glutathione dehydrogenase putative [Albugo laibachii Nc14]
MATNFVAKCADDYLGKKEVAQESTQPETSSTETMKAIVWKGSKKVACELKPKPVITHAKDVIVKVTYASVCSGSDSHLYSGEIPTVDEGFIMGHEACGVVDSVGEEVEKFKQGDRVVISFDISCGDCKHCKREEFFACDSTNDSELWEKMYGGNTAGAIFGYSRLLGNTPGSQAEYVRVPFGDVNCYPIPPNVPAEKALFISDVLSTSLHAVELAEVGEGDNVIIWGLGPIGLYAAKWCKLKKANTIVGIDTVSERIQLARKQFKIQVLDRTGMSSDQVMHALQGYVPAGGADAVIDATGFRFSQTWSDRIERAVGLETDSPEILAECFYMVRKYGRVSIIADYIGFARNFPIGHIVQKNLIVRSGQCPVQKYFKSIMKALENEEIDPTYMVTHLIKLDQVPEAYERLFYKEQGYIKVLIDVDSKEDKRCQEQLKSGHETKSAAVPP